MEEDTIVTTKNVISYRATLYSLLVIAPIMVAMILLGIYFDRLLLWGAFSIVLLLFVLATRLGTLRIPVKIGIYPQGLRLIDRRGGSRETPWENIVSIKPVRLDPGFYELRYLNRDGKLSFNILSEEPVQHIGKFWPK